MNEQTLLECPVRTSDISVRNSPAASDPNPPHRLQPADGIRQMMEDSFCVWQARFRTLTKVQFYPFHCLVLSTYVFPHSLSGNSKDSQTARL